MGEKPGHNSTPRVFVGIPTFNRPQFVRATLQSVLGQSFANLRVVVSDNGSEPGVASQVAEFVREASDLRVDFHRQPVNQGEYGQGRFFFSSLRQEDFMVIVHDDDELERTCIERAVNQLDADPSLAFFVSNPTMITADGIPDDEVTGMYRAYWGRPGKPEGRFDVLERHMACGFAPISGTVFRVESLRDSGFADPDGQGNFPFESDVFVRLGERGARAWFCPDPLVRYRFHTQNLAHFEFLNSPHVVQATIRLYERRRFTGPPERRRRAILGRLHRVNALLRAASGDAQGARREMLQSLRTNPRSARSWALAPLMLLAPTQVSGIMSPPVGLNMTKRTWRRRLARSFR